MSNDHLPNERIEELQQEWHGWGSPTGLGIALISLGVVILLLANAATFVN